MLDPQSFFCKRKAKHDFCEWINNDLLPIVREYHPNTLDKVSVVL